jgi:hypothetical protein
MKPLLLYITLFSLSITGYSQKLLWTSEFGGDNSNGAIISYDLDNNSTNTQLSLEGSPLYGFNLLMEFAAGSVDYSGGLMLGTDGNYYGVSSNASGLPSSIAIGIDPIKKGAFYRFVPATGKIEVLHSFVGNQEWSKDEFLTSDAFKSDVHSPGYTVLETAPGVFYGVALEGGVSGYGGVWKFDANINMYSIIGSFKDPLNDVGHNPVTKLIQGDGTNIYGLCRNNSNASSNNEGYLYKIDTSTDQLSYVDALNAAGWVMNHPHGQMVYNASTNTIYGTKDRFDVSSNWGGGVWNYNLTTSTQTNEWTILFSQLSVLGSLATGIVQGNDGKMYITTRDGGAHGEGTIIQYIPGGAHLKVYDFPVGFNLASGTGMQVSGSKIFGTCSFSVNGDQVWSYDYTNGSFQVLLSGDDTDPTKPGYNVEYGILVDNGSVVGRTRQGSDGGAGSIFSHNINTGINTILKSNGSREGRTIIGELTQLNDSIFVGYIGKGGPNTSGNSIAQDENGSVALFNVVAETVEHLASPSVGLNDAEYAQNTWMHRPLLASNGKLYYTNRWFAGLNFVYGLMEHDLSNPPQILKVYAPTLSAVPGPIELPGGKIVMAHSTDLEVYDINTTTLTTYTNTQNQ